MKSKKLFAVILVIFLTPVLVMSGFNLRIVQQDIQAIAGTTNNNLLKQNGTAVDKILSIIESSFSSLLLENSVQTFFSIDAAPKTFEDYSRLGDNYLILQRRLDSSDGYISDITLYNENKNILQRSHGMIDYNSDLVNTTAYNTVIKNDFSYYFDPAVTSVFSSGTKDGIIIAKTVYHDYKRCGVIVIELQTERFAGLLSDLQAKNPGIFLVADSENRLLFRFSDFPLAQALNESHGNPVGDGYLYPHKNDQWLVNQSHSKIVDWKYIWLLPMADLKSSSVESTNRILIIYCLFVFVFVFCAFFLAKGVYYPIEQFHSILFGTGISKRKQGRLYKKDAIVTQINIALANISNELKDIEMKSAEYALANTVLHVAQGKTLEEDELAILSKGMNIPANACFAVSVIRYNASHGFEKLDAKEAESQISKILSLFLQNISPDRLKFGIRLMGFMRDQAILILFTETLEKWNSEGMIDARAKLDNLLQELRLIHGLDIAISLGEAYEGLGNITLCLASAADKLEYRFIMGNYCFIHDIKSKEFLIPVQQNYNSQLASSLKLGKIDKAIELVRQFQDYVKKAEADAGLCLFYTKNSFYTVLQHIASTGTDRGKFDSLYQVIVDFENSFPHMEQATDYLCGFLNSLEINSEDGDAHILAQRAMQIILSEFNRDISLQETAARLGVSGSHLSRVFKAAYSKSFKECLTQFKLQKAKELLSSPNASVQNVALRVGYQDPKQFTRIFKKYDGITPMQYQHMTLADAEGSVPHGQV